MCFGETYFDEKSFDGQFRHHTTQNNYYWFFDRIFLITYFDEKHSEHPNPFDEKHFSSTFDEIISLQDTQVRPLCPRALVPTAENGHKKPREEQL